MIFIDISDGFTVSNKETRPSDFFPFETFTPSANFDSMIEKQTKEYTSEDVLARQSGFTAITKSESFSKKTNISKTRENTMTKSNTASISSKLTERHTRVSTMYKTTFQGGLHVTSPKPVSGTANSVQKLASVSTKGVRSVQTSTNNGTFPFVYVQHKFKVMSSENILACLQCKHRE